MNLCEDCKTIHTCIVCGVTEQCRDEIDPGTCDFRDLSKAHGYCMADMSLIDKIKFYGKDMYIVEQPECSLCGIGFASNTYCQKCVDEAK